MVGTSSSGDREVLGAEDGGSNDALTGEVEGTWRLMADSEDISLGKTENGGRDERGMSRNESLVQLL